jgi:ferritin-like protein
MAGSSAGLHEDPSVLGPETIERHRATVSLMEELEAIDWYDQRVHATTDDDLRAVLTNNRDDEKEHAAMALEWLRRHDPAFDVQLRRYLFSSGPIPALAPGAGGDQAAAEAPTRAAGSLGIGSLRSKESL